MSSYTEEIKCDKSESDLSLMNFPIEYYKISSEFLHFLKELLNNPLLCDYFQYEIMEFLSKIETIDVENYLQAEQLKNIEENFIASVYTFSSII